MWDRVGGPGSVQVVPPRALVVHNSQSVQGELLKAYPRLLKPITRPDPKFPSPTGRRTPPETALEQATEAHFIETPFTDVIDHFADLHNVQFEIDRKSLDDIGIRIDTPITGKFSGIRLRSALHLLLSQLDSTFYVADGRIVVASVEAEDDHLVPVAYDISKVVPPGAHDYLIEAITSCVAPAAWSDVGGPGTIQRSVRGTLDIRQSYHAHYDIQQLLADLRAAQ